MKKNRDGGRSGVVGVPPTVQKSERTAFGAGAKPPAVDKPAAVSPPKAAASVSVLPVRPALAVVPNNNDAVTVRSDATVSDAARRTEQRPTEVSAGNEGALGDEWELPAVAEPQAAAKSPPKAPPALARPPAAARPDPTNEISTGDVEEFEGLPGDDGPTPAPVLVAAPQGEELDFSRGPDNRGPDEARENLDDFVLPPSGAAGPAVAEPEHDTEDEGAESHGTALGDRVRSGEAEPRAEEGVPAAQKTRGTWHTYVIGGVIGFVLGGLAFCGTKKEAPVKEKECTTDCSKCQKAAPAPAPVQPAKVVELPKPVEPAINVDEVLSAGRKKPHAAAPKPAATAPVKTAGVCGPDKIESVSASEARTYYAAVNSGVLEWKDRTVDGDTVNGKKFTGTVTYCKNGRVAVTVTGDVNSTLKANVRKSIETQVKENSPKDVNFAFPYTVNVRSE